MITVGIKALNEEAAIGEALRCAIAAVAPFGGKVVLADSGSTDRTVDIARSYPVKIIQFKNTAERCCGAAAQLAFQTVDTEFFYLQDGDMTLNAAFLEAALALLRQSPGLAAVGGHVVERRGDSEEFQIRIRSQHAEPHRRPGIVDRLDGGGLYRVEAVRQAGFFADRNLHSFEEFDLAARLHAAGWQLARIDMAAVDHFGHVMGGYRLMWRRVRMGYTAGAGEVLRGSIGQAHFHFVLQQLRHLRHSAAVIAWWLMLCTTVFVTPYLTAALFLAPLALLTIRRGGLQLGLYSLAYWNAAAIGLVSGAFASRVNPRTPIEIVDLSAAGTHHKAVEHEAALQLL